MSSTYEATAEEQIERLHKRIAELEAVLLAIAADLDRGDMNQARSRVRQALEGQT